MNRKVALTRTLVVSLVGAALVGCSIVGGGDDGGAGNGTQVESGGDDASRGAVDVDASDRHPNGALLSASRVEVRERSVAVDMTLVNGFTDDVSLNGVGLWLVDDQGNSYAFDEPDQNADLTIGAGEELTGTLVFLGVVPADATSITLKSNVYDVEDPIDVNDRSGTSTNPEFLLEGLPLP